jgi:hypothetical protein
MATALPATSSGPQTAGQIHPLVEQIARLMDNAVTIPGTNQKVGLDALIGLIPVVGDLATAVIGIVVLKEAQRLGMSKWQQTRMAANYLLDFLVGAVPIIGDLLDVTFRAHARNVDMIRRHLATLRPQTPPGV